MTDCLSQVSLGFRSDKRIDVAFDAPEISSDGGWLLLRQMDDKLGLTEWFAGLVPDDRDTRKVEHTRWEQVRQRVFQIAMAYADGHSPPAAFEGRGDRHPVRASNPAAVAGCVPTARDLSGSSAEARCAEASDSHLSAASVFLTLCATHRLRSR